MNGNVTFEIVEKIGVIEEYETGWTKELNLVSWNGSAPKYDIRDWDEKHERMSRGITLTKRQIETMLELAREQMRVK